MSEYYPRVLLLTLPRLNRADANSTSLLFRSLLGDWPRERLFQVHSSPGNGDPGFCSEFYELGARERRFGGLFSYAKEMVSRSRCQTTGYGEARDLLVGSGAYELVFSPRMSRALRDWIVRVRPEALLTAGYSLSFAELAVQIAKEFRIPVVYYTPDDWADEWYRGAPGRRSVLSRVVQGCVRRKAAELVSVSAVRIAFNRYMQEEYHARYGVTFSVLMHGDDRARFERAEPVRLVGPSELSVVCVGAFDRARSALLDDVDGACRMLRAQGLKVRVSILPARRVREEVVRSYEHIRFESCPTHENLPCLLKGADVLLLLECFEETRARGIRTSVSSKAHLFMYSGRPIVVYSSEITGVCRYAREQGWALCVGQRSPEALAGALGKVLREEGPRARIVENARRVAERNHDQAANRRAFLRLVQMACTRGATRS